MFATSLGCPRRILKHIIAFSNASGKLSKTVLRDWLLTQCLSLRFLALECCYRKQFSGWFVVVFESPVTQRLRSPWREGAQHARSCRVFELPVASYK